jgi:regulator of sigma E protease
MLHLLKVPLIIIEVLVVFNLMIIVHEVGHFLAARWQGLVIEKFGIWFGKPLWKKKINGVEYSFGTIPFGGFVALPQMADMETIEGPTETPREKLPKISPLSKIIVAFAGPLFSFGLAVVFATIVWIVGRPVSESEATTTIGYVLPDMPAEKAGLEIGDKIVAVDGHPVSHFSAMMGDDSIDWRVVRSEGDTIPVTVERKVNGVPTTLTFDPTPDVGTPKWWRRKPLREIGIVPAQQPMVAEVEPGSAAANAGLEPDDVITAIDGYPAYSLEALSLYMATHPAAAYTLDVERDGKTVHLPFNPSGAPIADLVPDSPAALAGLQKGDIVTAVDGIPMRDGVAVTNYILSRGNKPIRFTYLRGGKTCDLTITPAVPVDGKTPHVGIAWTQDMYGISQDALGKFHVIYPNPAAQIGTGLMTIVNTIGAIASRKSDVGIQDMGGPVMMMRVYYMFFDSRGGWRLALWFSVVLNVNLALLNLLPIPVLDGGHILIALIEAIRRRPVNIRLLEFVQTSCALLIIGFMIYIAYFDVEDYFGPKDEMRFDQKAAAPVQSQK